MKTREHDDMLSVLFVDLKKAYDSIPIDALWRVFDKVGVPPTMLEFIRSDSIDVKNGLRQGYTLARTFLNIYYSAVVTNWREWCPCIIFYSVVTIRFKHQERKLVGDRRQ